MLAIIIPAHNEEDFLHRCLRSAVAAAADPALGGEPVQIIVVADQCSDATERIATRFPVITLTIFEGNVGAARAAGAAYALGLGARWLAFSDADTLVPNDWLSSQLACQADAVCGVIDVHDWTPEDTFVQQDFSEVYFPKEGHRHIHGANLGVSALAYQLAGGFQHYASHEDVDLVRRLEQSGASICWTAKTKVSTSARKSFRAPAGFGATLARVRRLVGLPAGGEDGISMQSVRTMES
ncbi:glycosyltransferase family A protein [Caballeronia sp. LZ035]|uniref:glycosyltransferase n=1 Tax=Caballeronia sp. LZ035 TaxID=3038568 RepID=UPI002856AB02|nr:glycosyltransferase family A protein [Caballeronia sp. LZ035]MDR5763225.1 glycosyltransferase family A protein [Caballeronia sp. LZ035]